MICTDAIEIKINIRWKILDYLILAIPFQQIDKVKYDKILSTISIIFIKSKYILPDNIPYVENRLFYDYKTAFGPNNSVQVTKVTLIFYRNNF